MTGKRVLINAGNLKVGGGVQVAASFLDELASMRATGTGPAWLADRLDVVASPEVAGNCGDLSGLRVTVREATFSKPSRQRYDVSFTVFGPEYVPANARRRIVGFADVTSLHPEFLPPATGASKARQVARRAASQASFRSTGRVVVEAPHIARDLERLWRIPGHRISVVPNTYNAVFDQPERWEECPVPREPGMANVCYVTRGYPHKNLAILGEVGEMLRRRGGAARFVLTLTAAEWAGLPELTRRHAVNLGPVTVPQLPNLYAGCDAAIFPSLFEAFSVAPLEALVTGTPLVASDRDFVRDVVGDAAWYAEPTDPDALADALVDALKGDAERVEIGRKVAASHPDATRRAWAYLDLIQTAMFPG